MEELLVINTRVDVETAAMLDRTCKMDERTRAQQIRWLIQQEYARRFSQPNPLVMVEEAEGVK